MTTLELKITVSILILCSLFLAITDLVDVCGSCVEGTVGPVYIRLIFLQCSVYRKRLRPTVPKVAIVGRLVSTCKGKASVVKASVTPSERHSI